VAPTSDLAGRAAVIGPPAPARIAARGDGANRLAILAQVASALILSTAGGALIAATGEWRISVGLLAGAAFVALGMLRPALFVGVLLFARPLLDGIPLSAGALVGVVLIGVCALVLTDRPHVVRPRATMAFGALLIVSAIATLPAFMEFGNVIGLEPLIELVRLAALFAMYMLAAQVVSTPEMVKRVFLIVGLSGVWPALVGLAELLHNPTKIANLGLVRISGTFVGPVVLSSYLALCILILLKLPREDLPRWVRWPALGVMGFALILSYGREGWVLLLLAIVLLHWRDNKRVIAAVAIAGVSLVMLVPGVHARVLPSEEATGSQSQSTFASYDWRVANWRALLERFGERPFTGWGLETVSAVNPRRPVGSARNPVGGFQAHNAAVRALVEGGVLLLGAVLALFAILIGALWRIMRTQGSPLAPYAKLLAAAWIAMVVVALTTNDLLDATALIYALLAMSGALEGAHSRMAVTRGGSAPARTR